MQKRISNIIWGIIFIILGFGVAGRIFFGWNFNIFFDGWWTLFIIIPCFAETVEKGWEKGSVGGLLVGIALLLMCQGVLSFGMFWRLLIPGILVLIGLKMLFKGSLDGDSKYVHVESGLCDYAGIFNSKKIRYGQEKFIGCTANAVFGSVEIDLRDSVIDEDVVIDASAIFGGVDLYVPPYVRVKVSGTPLFGTLKNRTSDPSDYSAPTVFVNATCMFGGVEIK